MIRLSFNGEITQFSPNEREAGCRGYSFVQGERNTQKARQLNEILEDICASLKDHYRDEGSATMPCKAV